MTDEKGTTTTTTLWQDNHGGKRGHELMTRKLADTIPALYANENEADYDTVLAPAKLFSPYSNWTWFITEMDPATGTCFGLVDGLEREIGYFDLTELAETTVFGGVPAVERDLYWEPKTLGEIKRGSRGDSPDNQETRREETVTDDNGTEIHPSDVVNVEEFLFGQSADDGDAGIAEEPDADTDTAEEPDVARELPTGDATDDAGDLETADEPGVAEDAGEQTAPAETETTEELKVVVSIKGGRATIGVQRPSADPHIESFDDPDLFGLADEFPAVVARATARWEEEPRYPAYVKPAPPARGQRRRQQQQETAQAATTEGEEQQPETLRLF